MHDIQSIRANPQAFDAGLARRGLPAMTAELLAQDSRRRDAQTELQAMQQRRNEASKAIGAGKSKGEDTSALQAEVSALKTRMPELEEEERAAAEALTALLAGIPNLPACEVPDGADEHANVEQRRVGAPRNFAFTVKDHVALGEALGLMDFEAAAKLSGARFVVLKGALARMERALAAFMLDLHTGEFGYQEISPPVMVRDSAVYGVGQLPKFAEDMFRTTNDFWLIPTAEVPLTNLVADSIIEADQLPMRVTAHTLCFRSEAGSAGRDTRGMIRQHQFAKVELVSITTPEQSAAEHERMTGAAEEVLKRLGLPFRTMLLSTGDMGFGSTKTYDIEVWLPGQNAYREISSCSNCGDFQTRRMNARYRDAERKPRFPHSLNGSGLAVGRTLIAVLENYQNEDGSITVPEALRPYMNGTAVIGAK